MKFALLVVVFASFAFVHAQKVISLGEPAAFSVEIPSCTQDFGDAKVSQRCKSLVCARRVEDGLFTQSEIERLHRVAKKGMSHRKAVGGPTILDINTGMLTKSVRHLSRNHVILTASHSSPLGYIRDTVGIENLFVKPRPIFTSDDFSHYGNIIRKLKDIVMQTFSVSDLYFTAPTFITRLDGNASWTPEGILSFIPIFGSDLFQALQ
jgi:hypothetical protein